MNIKRYVVNIGLICAALAMICLIPSHSVKAATSTQQADSLIKLIHGETVTYYTESELSSLFGTANKSTKLAQVGIVQPGDTVVLLKDYDGNFINDEPHGNPGTYGICKPITVDLGGHSVNAFAAGQYDSGALILKNGTIKNDVDDCGGVTTDYGAYIWEDLVVMGTSYISGHNVTIRSGYYKNGAFEGENGTVTIEGGFFTGDPTAIVNGGAGYIVKSCNVSAHGRVYKYHVVKGYKIKISSSGSLNGTVLSYAEGDETPITLPKAEKTGYHFDGWYTQPDGKGEYVGNAGDKLIPTSEYTIYAHFHTPDIKYRLDTETNKLIAYCVANERCEYYGEGNPEENSEPEVARIGINAPIRVTTGLPYSGASLVSENLTEFAQVTGLNLTNSSIRYGVVSSLGYVDTKAGDGTGATTTGGAPINPGLYVAIIRIGDKEITQRFRIKATEDEEDTLENLEDANPSSEPSYINRLYGFIDYSPREHVLTYGMDSEGNEVKTTYIDMFEEKLYTNLNIVCYSTRGTSWKTCTLESFNTALPKLFGNQTKLKIATSYDEKKKKPASDAVIISFGTIKRRAATTKFKVDYYYCRDDYGLSNGQWCMVSTKGSGINLSQYEIGICDNGKTIGVKGYGVWPGTRVWPECGGVWVSDLLENGKVGKEVYLYRKTATDTTPASKPVKITVSTVQKAPTIKVNYSKENIKLKEGMNIYFAESKPEFGPAFTMKRLTDDRESYEDYVGRGILKLTKNEAKKYIDISDYITSTRNKIFIWQSATSKKAASAIQVIELAARGSVPTNECVTITKGSAKLVKGYEIYDTKTKKWKTSISKITKTTEFLVRVKASAKGGKENDTTYASGISGILELTYGTLEGSTKKGITGAIVKPVTEE